MEAGWLRLPQWYASCLAKIMLFCLGTCLYHHPSDACKAMATVAVTASNATLVNVDLLASGSARHNNIHDYTPILDSNKSSRHRQNRQRRLQRGDHEIYAKLTV